MNFSFTEENYLKAIYKLSEQTVQAVSTNSISEEMKTTAASVTDMLKRLSDKKTIIYRKYQGVRLTESGTKIALEIIRKHRLWETFLVEKLEFSWDEVHEIAEQLEHIQSSVLTNRLDRFLGFPSIDPHGDPIPDENGRMNSRKKILLSELEKNSEAVVVGINDSNDSLLKYLNKLQIQIGTHIKVKDIFDFDQSIEIIISKKSITTVSETISKNIFVSTF